MARSITIRDVPDEIVDELSARASRSGRSLQEYLKAHLAAFVERPDPQDWAQRVRARIEVTGVNLPSQQILAELEAERR